jgi:hypothetical protein
MNEFYNQSDDEDNGYNVITTDNLGANYVIVNESQLSQYNNNNNNNKIMRRDTFNSFANSMPNFTPYDQSASVYQTIAAPASTQMYYNTPQLSYYPTIQNELYYQ